MRTVRLILVLLTGAVLVTFAVANRTPVPVHLFPGQFGRYLGGTWSLQVPLFMVILLSLLVGMLAGLLWEWVRAAAHRRHSARLASDVHALEREVGGLRQKHAAPRDPVLAVLDGPVAPPRTAGDAKALVAPSADVPTADIPALSAR